MSISDKFCLKWNDFYKNVSNAFGTLREDNYFNDVTLVCKEGQTVEAHKLILAASSPFFKRLFVTHKHVHPMIYMRGWKYEDVVAILDFLYYGEANIYQENLETFMNIAEELNLKGLSTGVKEITKDSPDDSNRSKKLQEKNMNNDSIKTETIDQAISNEKPVLDTTVTSEKSGVVYPKLDC